MMKAIIAKNNIINHLVGVLLVLMALSDIFSSRSLKLAAALLSIAVFLFFFVTKDRNYFKEAMLFVLFLLIMSVVNLFFTQNNFGGSLTLLGSLLLAFIYFQVDGKKLIPWVMASYLITVLFIGYHIFVLGTHANLIYDGLSRNHAGFAVVFWTIFLLFHVKIVYNRFPIIPPLYGLVLAFFLFGRTSLIVSALLLTGVFFYKFRSNTKILAATATLFIGACYYLWLHYGSVLMEETNLNEGLDTPRWRLWRIYFENLDFLNFFTGIDVTNLSPLYDQFSGNPHNSFIKFHSRTGLGCIVLIILYFVSLVQYAKTKQFYILLLLFLLTLRAFFDGDILIGNFDFIFFIVTFYWIKTD